MSEEMKLWKWSLTGILLITVLFSIASAHIHPGLDPIPTVPTVSPWAQEEVKKAQELGLVYYTDLPADYRSPITRQEFRKVAMNYVAMQVHSDRHALGSMVAFYLGEQNEHGHLKNVFRDGSEEDMEAYLLGVVTGRGNGLFDPNGLITRQEAAVMVTRAYGVCGGTLPKKEGTAFEDEEEIADWASASAMALASWEVMNGMAYGSFLPEGQYSVEQCLVTFLRLYENAPVSRKNGNVKPLFTYEQGIEHLEEETKSSKINQYGRSETLRVEGPLATFIRMDWGGTMHCTSALCFVYRDGGIRIVDLGVCNSYMGLSPIKKLENPHFSEDGRTFFCTITLPKDVYGLKNIFYHEKGIYHITIDVDTCQYQLQREALP